MAAYENWKIYIEFVTGVRTDVTADVETISGPFTVAGGETAESTDDGLLTLQLRNTDQRYTPGNVLGPHHPNIKTARPIYVEETIADQVIDIFTGKIQFPDIESWVESNSTEPREQTITITAVDRIAELARGRKFIGTLAEHIIYNGGTALKGYWPLNEESAPATNPVDSSWRLEEKAIGTNFGISPTDPTSGSITYGGSPIPPADDTGSVRFTPARDTVVNAYGTAIMLQGGRSSALTLTAGQVMTVVAWVKAQPVIASVITLIEMDKNLLGGIGGCNITSAGILDAYASNAPNWSGSVVGPAIPTFHPTLIGVRFGFDPAVMELWVGSGVYADVMTVTTPANMDLTHMNIGWLFDGSVSHAQVYLGAEDDWDHDDFLAQHQTGLTGLERQTTGERIRTVLQYAGVAGTELGRIDGGASVMQRVTLANRSPYDVAREAVDTEQGALYAAGDGKPVFADRLRLYNV